MISVFYDGKCGLCRKEIEHYKRIAPAAVFEWVDITVDTSTIEKMGISYADGLKLLHAQDSNGKLYVGVDVFLLIWRQIPRWRILEIVVASPFIRPIANCVYRSFATWRFKRLSHCQRANQLDEKSK